MSRRGTNLVRLAGAGVVAGVLAAGIALPAVGGASLGIMSAVNVADLRPVDLTEPPPAEVSIVQDARGNEIARFYEEYREVVQL
ncbi:penicillin-binding protein, partial [Streptosporangium sp. NPDC048865]